MAALRTTGRDLFERRAVPPAELRLERDIVDLGAEVHESGRIVAACHGIAPPPLALPAREAGDSLRAMESALIAALCGRDLPPRPGLIAAQLYQVFLYREGRLARLVPGILSTIDARTARGRPVVVRSELPAEYATAGLARFGLDAGGGCRLPSERRERAAA